MERTIFIKNMVCNRCKSVLRNEFNEYGIKVNSIELGEVILEVNEEEETMAIVNKILKNNGFEIIEKGAEIIVEKIKTVLIKLLEEENSVEVSNSEYLSQQLHKDYSILSKLFSSRVGSTIEKYFINLKIEKAKELIQMGSLSFSEIAYTLDYKSSSHLSKQFKTIAGMSMRAYKEAQQWNRKTFDQIV